MMLSFIMMVPMALFPIIAAAVFFVWALSVIAAAVSAVTAVFQ